MVKHLSSSSVQVLRSIGYKSIPVSGEVPFDSKKGIIPNHFGKINSENGKKSEFGFCALHL